MKKKCLIVDDVDVSQYAAAVTLQAMGFDILVSDGIQSCLDLLKTASPDFMIIDWHLRRDSGLELAKSIRNLERFKDIPIFVCSGVERVESNPVASASLINAYLQKPISRKDLEVALRKANLL